MTFSAGRRVASPFAQRAAQHAANETQTPDISTIPDTTEPEPEAPASDAPVVLEEHPEAVGESNNQEVANEALDEAQEPTSDEAPADKPARGRGRPRPDAVKERDDRVYDYVVTSPGRSKAQVAEDLGVVENEVYMSLFRLRKAGKIEKRRENGIHAWHPVEENA